MISQERPGAPCGFSTAPMGEIVDQPGFNFVFPTIFTSSISIKEKEEISEPVEPAEEGIDNNEETVDDGVDGVDGEEPIHRPGMLSHHCGTTVPG